MTDLKSYIEDLNDLPQDILLGRIVVYTIYDHPVRLSDVKDMFQRLQLNEKFVPAPNKRYDAFRKATKELDKVNYPMSGNRTATLLCRDVATTSDYIVRSIVREIRDSKRKKLQHIEAIHCTFYRGNENVANQIRQDLLEPGEVPEVAGAARRLQERLEYHADYLDNMKIRAMVRGYLKHLNCVEIKPGVYYVNTRYDDELHRLAEMVGLLGGGCHMNMIPIVNIKREREFLTTMFEREAADQLQNLTRDIEELLSDRKKITPAMYAKMRARFDETMTNAEEHIVTLDVSQNITSANSEVAMRALKKLQSKMLSEG